MDLSSLIPADNAVFSGGIGLALVAGGAQVCRAGYQVGLRLLRRHLLVTLEVTSKDRSYPWVLQWLAAQSGARTQHLSVETIALSTTKSSNTIAPTGQIGFSLIHGPGQHLLKFKDRFVLVQRTREQQMVDLNSGKPWEKVVFTSYGRDVSIFHAILQDAYQLATTQEVGKTIIFTNWGAEWRQFGQARVKRSLDSVILDANLTERIVHDVQEWIGSAEWYRDRGIPYRRGYLLHGAPGSGKTSFIYALAGSLNYNICVLNLNERGLTDDRLALALSNIPPQSIVLLEDIDAAFSAHRTANSNHSGSDVTFSGLLNVLDGVSASEERLVFMTTNHVDRLDPALIRPGRVDLAQHIGDASDYQVRALVKKFFESEVVSEEQSEQFVKTLRSTVKGAISMAALQGHLLRHKASFSSAMESLFTLQQELSQQMQAIPAVQKEDATRVQARVAAPVKPRPVKAMTADQVDKMFFNPQKDWDRS